MITLYRGEKMRKLGVLLIVPLLLISGCNGLSAAMKAENVITAVLTIAKAEVAVVPAQDQAIYTNFVNLGITLDGQLASCITSVQGLMGKSSQFAACFTAFATGLTTPAELAQLRLLSAGTQGKVQLYVVAIITGINVALAFFSSTAVSPPTIAATPTSSQDLRALRSQLGY
jgi:hypothetical protein